MDYTRMKLRARGRPPDKRRHPGLRDAQRLAERATPPVNDTRAAAVEDKSARATPTSATCSAISVLTISPFAEAGV